jgi:hypothetical protein
MDRALPFSISEKWKKILTECKSAGLAFQVFSDLKIAKNWQYLEPEVDEKQNIYLIGSVNNESTKCIILPCWSKHKMSPKELLTWARNPSGLSLYLAIVDSDSTVVYYNIQNGLHVNPE